MRKFLLLLAIWLILIRLWMNFVLPLIGGNQIVQLLIKDGYHHWQFGIVILVFCALLFLMFREFSFLLLLLVAFSVALVLDQTFYIAEFFGANMPYKYLSIRDNLVTLGIIIVVLIVTKLTRRKVVIAAK